MAYGKIKADAIIYDDSGSDVEKTIASLAAAAPTAGPTFTGTVTIPTATAGDNSTKAASTAFVVASFAPKASPALTGTATAVNLTISGNLTVNGTTTTVASTNTTIADNLIELNSGASSNTNDCGILIERGSTGDNAILMWDESADKFIVGTTTGTASSTGDITLSGVANLEASILADKQGDVRKIPGNNKTSAYSLVTEDANEYINITTGGVTFQVNQFVAGDCITLINNSSSNQTITCSAVTMYLSGDTSTKTSLTLKGRAMATFLCVGGNVFYGSGAGLE